MAKKKTTKVKVSKDQNKAVTDSLIWVIIGLMMALAGFIWATYTSSDPEIIGANIGAGLLGVFGLIIAVSAVLIMAGVVITTQSKAKKRRK